MGKEIASQVKKHRVQYRINPRRNMWGHILIKLTDMKHKETILKAPRERSNIQWKAHTIHSRSFSRNCASQKIMSGYI